MIIQKYLIFFVYMFESIIAETFSVNECTTPKNEKGVCIRLMSCQSLLKVLKHHLHTKSIEDYEFLKKSQCGFDGKAPKVCCLLDNISPDNSDSDEIVNESIISMTEGKNDTSDLSSKSKCGRISANREKIVGGAKAELGYWPWIVALGYRYINRRGVITDDPLQWFCAGSLITDKHVLTAAHCVNHQSYNFRLAVVRLGDLDLNPNVTDGANPIDLFIERSIVHGKYNNFDFTNDIALIKLNQSVPFSIYIQPICLLTMAEMNDINVATTMPFVAGWGSTYPIQNNEPINHANNALPLMEVQVPIVNTTECKKNYFNQKSVIDDRVICAGYPNGRKDSCRGDSGGPLMWPKKDKYFLIGIVSFGKKECGKPNSPGVYTRVSTFIDWIEEKLNIFK